MASFPPEWISITAWACGKMCVLTKFESDRKSFHAGFRKGPIHIDAVQQRLAAVERRRFGSTAESEYPAPHRGWIKVVAQSLHGNLTFIFVAVGAAKRHHVFLHGPVEPIDDRRRNQRRSQFPSI
jgi:hypothetical protein